MYFTIRRSWSQPGTRRPRRYETYNFSTLFIVHHYNILSLSDLCLRLEKKIFKYIRHFHYLDFMATLLNKNPCPEGHKIYNLGRDFLGYYYLILSLFKPCLEEEKEIFIKYCNFTITLLWPRPST